MEGGRKRRINEKNSKPSDKCRRGRRTGTGIGITNPEKKADATERRRGKRGKMI